jgi:hypothetical protein
MSVALMAVVLHSVHGLLADRNPRLRQVFLTFLSTIAAVGLLLGVLHGIEAVLWAAAYLWVGAIASPTGAILYSVDSMTTRGSSGLMLEERWRMMGALEAADGMLLFGISTAFVFAVMQVFWPTFLTGRHSR